MRAAKPPSALPDAGLGEDADVQLKPTSISYTVNLLLRFVTVAT
jgi:hypothetical protein